MISDLGVNETKCNFDEQETKLATNDRNEIIKPMESLLNFIVELFSNQFFPFLVYVFMLSVSHLTKS